MSTATLNSKSKQSVPFINKIVDKKALNQLLLLKLEEAGIAALRDLVDDALRIGCARGQARTR